MSNALSLVERGDYKRLNKTVTDGRDTFMHVGQALLAIKERRLYREEFSTFEEYCVTEHKFSGRRANQIIDAAAISGEVARKLSPSNDKDLDQENRKCISTLLPSLTPSEAQARALKSAPEEERAEAFAEAVKTAPNGKVTAEHVQKVVAKRKQPDAATTNDSGAAGLPWDDMVKEVEESLGAIEEASRRLNKTLGRQKVRGGPDFARDFTWFFKPGHVDVFAEAVAAVRACLPERLSDEHPGYISRAQAKAEGVVADRKGGRA